MAKEIERSGIPVAYVTTLTSLAEEMRANRIVAGVRIPHPLGNPMLTPDNESSVRLAVTRRALDALSEPVEGPHVFAVDHPGVR
jgi:glycine reductase